MKQGMAGGLLVIVVAILSPFGPQVLKSKEIRYSLSPPVSLSAEIYTWTAWVHGGADAFLRSLLMILWGILLMDAVVTIVSAFVLAVKAVGVFALNKTRNTSIDFDEIISCLIYSCVTFSICMLCLYLASWVDVGMGAWTTQASFFTENTYNFLFFWIVKGCLYVCPLLLFVSGLFILEESCRKWGQNMLRG